MFLVIKTKMAKSIQYLAKNLLNVIKTTSKDLKHRHINQIKISLKRSHVDH